MLLLSGVIGGAVLGSDGRVLGRLADLTASLGESVPRMVARLLITRRHGSSLLVPWDQVTHFGPSQVVLSTDAAVAERFGADTLDEREILLVRDVLDTQVIDVVGQRLARVADVVLARTPAGRLELAGVEVGFGAVLRRLKLGLIAGPAGRDVIAWSDLHLTSERGHAVQLASPLAAVHHLDARGLAALVGRMDTESASEVLVARGPEVAAAVVGVAHPVVGERVLRALPRTEAARIVAAMPAEHAGRWRKRLDHAPAMMGRRFLRSRVWPRRHHVSEPTS